MVIRKVGKQTWKLYSSKTHRILGHAHSLKAIKQREREVQYFKHSHSSVRRSISQ